MGYFIRTKSGTKGPFTPARIAALVEEGKLLPEHRILDAAHQPILVSRVLDEAAVPEAALPPTSVDESEVPSARPRAPVKAPAARARTVAAPMRQSPVRETPRASAVAPARTRAAPPPSEPDADTDGVEAPSWERLLFSRVGLPVWLALIGAFLLVVGAAFPEDELSGKGRKSGLMVLFALVGRSLGLPGSILAGLVLVGIGAALFHRRCRSLGA